MVRPGLVLYERLALASREALLALKGLQHTAAEDFGDDLAALVKAGVLEPLHDAERVRVALGGRPLLLVLRAAARCEVLTSEDPQVLLRYIQATYTHEMRRALLIHDPFMRGDLARMLARCVEDPGWVDAIVDPDTHEDLHPRRARQGGRPRPLAELEVRDLLGYCVDELRERSDPVAVLDLRGVLGESDAALFDRMLQTGLRHLVLFPGIDASSGRLVVGLAARARKEFARTPLPEPVVTDVPLTDVPAHGALDLHHLMVAVAGGEVRVRTDMYLYKRDREALLQEFTDPDELSSRKLGIIRDVRVGLALSRANELGFLSVVHGHAGRHRLQASAAGRAWLALDPDARHRALLEQMGLTAEQPGPRRALDDSGNPDRFGLAWRRVLGRTIGGWFYRTDMGALMRVLKAELARLPRAGAVGMCDFFAHAASARNPLLGQPPHAEALARVPDPYGYAPTREEGERTWTSVLVQTSTMILWSWGGLRVGSMPAYDDGEVDLALGLTPLGAYLLGLEAEFPATPSARARVIVQPNFEIVFMHADPGAEAELAPFCERLGRGVGTLFRITRTSVARAAAAGMPQGALLDTLMRLVAEAIPANVLTEIRAWHDRQRVLVLERPWILRCGDAQTAERVLSVGSRFLEPLTDDTLALRPGQKPAAVAKALAPHGVTIDGTRVQAN